MRSSTRPGVIATASFIGVTIAAVTAFSLASPAAEAQLDTAPRPAAVVSNLDWFIDRQVTIRLADRLPPRDVPLSASSAINGENHTILGTLVDADDDWVYVRCSVRFHNETVTDVVAIRAERIASIASRE